MVKIEFSDSTKTIYCTFSGRLDTVTSLSDSNTIERELQGVTEPDNPKPIEDYHLVFDMQEVTFVCSSFIKMCIANARKTPSGGFSLVNCDPFIKKTFKITGLDASFPIT